MTRQSTTLVEHCRIIDLPRIGDPRGNLSFVEGGQHIPFPIQRAFWIFDVPGGQQRGPHAYYKLEEFVVAISGSFDVLVDDGVQQKTFSLNRSFYGLYIPHLIWRTFDNFSTNSLALILASRHYEEADYLRQYHKFTQAKT